MSIKLQHTTISQDGKGTALVELAISVGEEQAISHAQHTALPSSEILGDSEEAIHVRVRVKEESIFLPTYQSVAIDRAIKILQSLKQQIADDAKKIET